MLIFYAQLQWRTEEGVRGLEPFRLAYDLRNKRARMHQNRVFSTKNTKKNFGSGHSPLPRPFASGEEDTPSPRPTPFGACWTSTPPIPKSWVRHWLTVMFNINSSCRRQEYAKLLSSYCQNSLQLHYNKDPSFYEQIWQFIIKEQSWSTNRCRFYCDNLTKYFS